MPSFLAKTDLPLAKPHRVVFVVYPDIVLLDLAGPLQVFSRARDSGTGELAYETSIVSFFGGPVMSDTVVQVDSVPIENWLNRTIHTLVVVGGFGAPSAMQNGPLVEQVKKLASRSHRVCSVCSGALILGAAGLLDGRRATTHWDDCALLSESFPDVNVEVDPIYIRDGNVWTSAGITAGLDMTLAIVAEDLGRENALTLAQSFVTYMVRPGGQSQFSPALARQRRDGSARFDALHIWIEGNLQGDLRADALAAQENMSPRNFHRLYTDAMGTTPAKAVEAIRVDAARALLETSDAGIKSVALRCGFGDEERMRRAFIRLLGVPPTAYRERFRMTDRA